MASPAFEQILAVQAFDLTLRQLAYRNQNHPARAELAELLRQRAEIDEHYQQVKARHHDLERERKRLEDSASLLEDKRKGLDQKLYSGKVTATKELLAIQDEMASLVRQRNALEDDELELMVSLEETASELADFDRELADIDDRAAVIQQELDVELAALEAEAETEAAARTAAAAAANPELLSRYENLRDLYDGVAVARLVNGACDGCHISLSAVAMDRMAKMDDEAVVTCEDCGRLLVL